MASQIPKTILRVHQDLKENYPSATAIVLQVPFFRAKILGRNRPYINRSVTKKIEFIRVRAIL